MAFDIRRTQSQFPVIEKRFPIEPNSRIVSGFSDEKDGKIVFLDSAATTQKPRVVIESESEYYSNWNSNVHRGGYCLAEKSSDLYENARQAVADFINASRKEEIIFTKGTTESINLVANSYAKDLFFKDGEGVLFSELEHHSNLVPWQQLPVEKFLLNIDDTGQVDLNQYEQLLKTGKVKLVAVAHISNTLGTVLPVKELARIAHENGAVILVDGAQAVAHTPVDVQDLDCDFYAFSGHKMYGPMGTGVLYGKEELLIQMPPYQMGGGMIDTVTYDISIWGILPNKFEAGTPNVAGAIGLARAIDFMAEYTWEDIMKHEDELLKYGCDALSAIEGVRIIGNADNKRSIISFLVKGTHPYDVAHLLDRYGVAVRAGSHCAQPLMAKLRIPGTIRASFGIYNDEQDIDILVRALNKIKKILV